MLEYNVKLKQGEAINPPQPPFFKVGIQSCSGHLREVW